MSVGTYRGIAFYLLVKQDVAGKYYLFSRNLIKGLQNSSIDAMQIVLNI